MLEKIIETVLFCCDTQLETNGIAYEWGQSFTNEISVTTDKKGNVYVRKVANGEEKELLTFNKGNEDVLIALKDLFDEINE